MPRVKTGGKHKNTKMNKGKLKTMLGRVCTAKPHRTREREEKCGVVFGRRKVGGNCIDPSLKPLPLTPLVWWVLVRLPFLLHLLPTKADQTRACQCSRHLRYSCQSPRQPNAFYRRANPPSSHRPPSRLPCAYTASCTPPQHGAAPASPRRANATPPT